MLIRIDQFDINAKRASPLVVDLTNPPSAALALSASAACACNLKLFPQLFDGIAATEISCNPLLPKRKPNHAHRNHHNDFRDRLEVHGTPERRPDGVLAIGGGRIGRADGETRQTVSV